MKLSVNILAWNTLDTIEITLPLLIDELKGYEHEIIIVDNGSEDGIDDYIKMFPRVKFIKNEENRGISIGKNQGINASSGDYLLLLDGDVVPVPNSISLMMEFLDEHENIHAIGMYPNKFVNEPNSGHKVMHEEYCYELFEPALHRCACLFYGMYKREMFDYGLRMTEEGEFGQPGYGWEDHDFYLKMKRMGYQQYAADINSPRGRYFHKINSSIRNMGHETYRETSKRRSKQFKEIWDASGQGSDKTSG
jgi:glycosyltransferase involved in cell wall biosynthesis